MSALQLEVAAELLGPILDEVVFVGGATVHLWLTEPGALPACATEDYGPSTNLARSTFSIS